MTLKRTPPRNNESRQEWGDKKLTLEKECVGEVIQELMVGDAM